MNSERDTQTIYEVFRDGRPKYRLLWTNDTKHFFINDEEVSEEAWTESIEKDKS